MCQKPPGFLGSTRVIAWLYNWGMLVSGVAGRPPKNICLRSISNFSVSGCAGYWNWRSHLRQIFFGVRPATPDTITVYVIFQTNPTTVYWGVVRCMYLLSSGGENYFFNKLLFTLYIRLRARRREVVLLRIRRVWHKQHNQIELCAWNFSRPLSLFFFLLSCMKNVLM